MMNAEGPWYFAEFCLDAAKAQLTRDGRKLKLRPKSFDVLHYLVKHADRLVTKDDLLAALWPGLIVGETNLQLCLSEIRRALGEDPRNPRFIETIHRRGYCFHAPPAQAAVKAESTDATQLLDIDGGFQPPWISSSPSPFVGRYAELARLEEHLEAAHRGQRQAVFVSGEPGIGKTTLVKTFLQRLSGTHASAFNTSNPSTNASMSLTHGDHRILIAYGQCAVQYGAEVPYLPVFEAMGMLVKWSDDRVIDSLRKYAPSWVSQMPGLLPAQGDEATQNVSRITTERLLREFAEAMEFVAMERTVVLWLDDLHDSDTSSLDLLSYLALRKQYARLLVIGTYRPGEIHRAEHPLKHIQQTLRERNLCASLEVALLSQAAIESLVCLRLPGQIAFSLPVLSRLILARTEGNPLFVSHVIEGLIEMEVIGHREGQWILDSNKEELLGHIPVSLQDMLLGQLRILPAAEQEVLDVASVVGTRFSIQALCAVLPGSELEVEEICERLAGEERFVRRDGVEKWPNAVVASCYRFRHALHQEVAYHQIPSLKREALHQIVAEAKEISHGADIASVAVELASHFERSRDFARAVHYCQPGFQQASRRSAFKEGVRLALKGLDLLRNLPDSLLRVRTELGLSMALITSYSATIGHASDEVGALCRRALDLCGRAEDDVELFPVLSGLFGYCLVKSDYATALAAGHRLLSIAQTAQSSELMLASRVALGMASWHSGDHVTACNHFEQREWLYRPEDHLKYLQFGHDSGVTSLSFISAVYWYLGYPDRARRAAEEGIALARQLSHAYTWGIALLFGARPYQECGEIARVHALVEEHESICRGQDFTEADARRQLRRGWVLSQQGRLKEAIESIQSGLDICSKLGTKMEYSYHLTVLAQAQCKNSQYQESLESLDEALRFSHDAGEAYVLAEIHRLRAEILLARLDHHLSERGVTCANGDVGEFDADRRGFITEASETECLNHAEANIQKALTVSREQQARSLELRAAVSLVKLYLRMDKKAPSSPRLMDACRELREIYTWFSEGMDTPDLREAASLLRVTTDKVNLAAGL